MTLSRRQFVGSSLALAGTAGLAGAQDAPEEARHLGKTPHTKFAVNVEMWWARQPFLKRIQNAAALGFAAVEFWPWQNKDLDAVAELTQKLGVEVAQFTAWGFRPGLNEPRNHDAFVQAIVDGCAVAKKLRCRKMTVVGGDDVRGMTQPEMHENIITGLKRAAPIAEEHDVMLILEPMNIRVDHKGHCLYGSAPAIRICEAVGSSHVKINWDLYHMQISEGDLCGHLRDGIEWVGYLQLADNPGRNEPGTGEVHYNRVLKEAYDRGYRDYVGLECRPKTNELAAAKAVAAADTW
jgi:hydroxypyruvate isomerase